MKLGALLQRLAGGLRRHGLSGIGRLVAGALRRRGVVGTLKAFAGRGPFLAAAGEPLPSEERRKPMWPPQIDRAGTVSGAAWTRWLDRSRPAAAPTPAASSPPLVIVLAPGPAGAAGVERTRRAAAAANIPVVPAEAAPTAPQALHLFLQAGDAPEPALFDALRQAAADPEAQAITFDLCRQEGERVRPLPLPGANLPLLKTCDYIFSRAALKAPLLRQAASPRDAILAWCAGRHAFSVRQGWRHLAAPPLLLAEISDEDLAARERIRTAPPARSALGVTAIICTHNKGHLMRQLVRQLLALGDDQLAEIVIVSNNTSHPHALQTLADLAGEARIRIIHDDGPFNFSRQVNAGVRAARGQGPLLLLNDDIVPVSADWLAVLAGGLEDPEVGAVGPLLLYPDERVQHAGMYTRFPTGVGHALRGAVLPFDDPLSLAAGPREVSCLTGAVLLTTRDAFARAGGLDENFALSFQDVDYCLKLHQAGLRNLFEPRSILLHMESVSLHNANTDPHLLRRRHAEHQAAVGLWGGRFPRDPYLPAVVDLADEGLRRLARPQGPPRA